MAVERRAGCAIGLAPPLPSSSPAGCQLCTSACLGPCCRSTPPPRRARPSAPARRSSRCPTSVCGCGRRGGSRSRLSRVAHPRCATQRRARPPAQQAPRARPRRSSRLAGPRCPAPALPYTAPSSPRRTSSSSCCFSFFFCLLPPVNRTTQPPPYPCSPPLLSFSLSFCCPAPAGARGGCPRHRGGQGPGRGGQRLLPGAGGGEGPRGAAGDQVPAGKQAAATGWAACGWRCGWGQGMRRWVGRRCKAGVGVCLPASFPHPASPPSSPPSSPSSSPSPSEPPTLPGPAPQACRSSRRTCRRGAPPPTGPASPTSTSCSSWRGSPTWRSQRWSGGLRVPVCTAECLRCIACGANTWFGRLGLGRSLRARPVSRRRALLPAGGTAGGCGARQGARARRVPNHHRLHGGPLATSRQQGREVELHHPPPLPCRGA